MFDERFIINCIHLYLLVSDKYTYPLPVGHHFGTLAPPDAKWEWPYCQGEAPVRFSEYVGGFVY
jgi:hypothetical protein